MQYQCDAVLAVAVVLPLTDHRPFLQQDAIAMTSCCKPCDTQPRMAPLIASISPGSPGIFLPGDYRLP